jgi:DNA-binding GntR family transcriptional regulator
MEPSLREQTRAHRAEVVHAMNARDADRAAEALRQHISEVQHVVMRDLQPDDAAQAG